MTNTEFKSELQKLVGTSTTARPFVCEGYPMECDVFIVGINPATAMQSDFWSFWDNDQFDKRKWFEQTNLDF